MHQWEHMLKLDKSSENIDDIQGMSAFLKESYGKFRELILSPIFQRIESIAKDVLTVCGYQLTSPPASSMRLCPIELFSVHAKGGWNVLLRKCKKRSLVSGILFNSRYFMAVRG